MRSASLTDGAQRPRVLVTVPGLLSDQMAGPVIRAWAIARALSARFDVTAAVPDPKVTSRDGVRIVPFERRRLAREMPAHDAVVSACVPPFLLRRKGTRPTLVVSDQYDPADLEASHLPDSFIARRRLKSQIAVMDLQLRYADVVLHANRRQRERIESRIDELGRVEPLELVELPFGLGEPPPAAGGRPLRGRFPQIRDRDTIVLWWGVAWNWLDPDTAVRAMAQLSGSRPDIKLVFAPAKISRSSNAGNDLHNGSERARETARELGLLDRTILFWDDWIPFDRRHEFLAEADIGLTLHGLTEEAHFSSRVRYLDYLWAGLPCILAEGDQLGARFGDSGFASLVPACDPDEVNAAVTALADDPGALDHARRAGVALAREYRWEALVDPLAAVLDRELPGIETHVSTGLSFRVGGYYARRIADTAVFAFDRSPSTR